MREGVDVPADIEDNKITYCLRHANPLGHRLGILFDYTFTFPLMECLYKELDYNNKMKKDKQNACKKEKITNLDYWGAPLSLHCNHFGKWSFDPSYLQ